MSYRSLMLAGAILVASSFGLSSARAESRVALVIGNAAYQAVPALPNPVNDSKAVADLLRTARFEVITARDLGQAEMRRTVGEFARTVAARGPDTVALVYYAGHGLQVDGDNYLVPVDAQIRQEADVPLQTVRLADLMNALAAVPSKTRIVMLDACRNNPFSELNKTAGRGLAIVDAPNGSIVSYATAPGSEAEDGDGRNSPYTTAFLTAAREPGVPIEQAFKRVRYAVHQATDGRQTPWESSSLTGDFAFFPGEPQTTGVATSAGPAAAGTQVAALGGAGAGPTTRSADAWRAELQPKSAREAYEIVVREDQLEAYQAYLDLFPAEAFTTRVRATLDRRLELLAWHDAVTINTAAAYRAFLAEYPGSDYAATAQRLTERTGRSLGSETRERACSTPTIRRRADLPAPERRAALDTTVIRDITPVVAPVAPVVSTAPVLGGPVFGRGPFGHGKPVLPVVDHKPPQGGPTGPKGPIVIDRKPPVVVDKKGPRIDRRVVLDRKPIVSGPKIVTHAPIVKPMVARPLVRPMAMSMRPMGGFGGGMRLGGGGFGRMR